jgi:adenylate cyclase
LALTYLLAEGYRNLVIEKRSRFVQRAFSTYVAPSLVQVIMKDPKRLELGGEKRTITVLFSDIRGFTTLSEKLNPEQLVTLLNRYLGPMSDIVLEEQGTLDKYIGDAIMAEYNAPVDVPDHAARACRTALRMLDTLAKLNEGFERDFGMRLDIGIGLNTGEAVVGNMGTTLRFDYTAIGDTVNLSSRLEGQNKTYGTHIIVTEDTRHAAGGEFLFRPLDSIRVKGKHQPVQIFELMNFTERASAGEQERARQFAQALELYRVGRFNEAAASFESLSQANQQDAPAALYLRRCREYVAAPPEQWDGVYVAVSK